MKDKIAAIFSVLLLVALLGTLFPSSIAVSAQTPALKTIPAQGIIVNNISNYIAIDPAATIASNNLSVGFALDNHWDLWLKTPEYSQLAQNANFKIITIYDSSNNSGVSFQPCIYWNETTHTGVFNWTNVDALVKSFYKIGAQPLICLGGTAGSDKVHFPNGMYINPDTSLPSPEDYANYAAAWVEHFKSVDLPVTYYEVFNEIEQIYYRYNINYNETKLAAFFEDYMAAYTAMHNVNDQILVGNDASTYKNFLNYWVAHNGKLDFLAFHKYDCDLDPKTGLARVETHFLTGDDTYYGVTEARKVVNEDLQIICSEYGWCAGWETGTNPGIQQMVGAVALALTLRQEVLLNMQYNVYFAWDSSASWQASIGTGLGFGMVNQDNNQPWYPYYVNQFFGQNLSVGDRIIGSTSSTQDLRTLSWIHGDKVFTLVISTVDSPKTITFGSFATSGNYSLIDNTFGYMTPKLQTGTLDINNQITVKGYAVLLLESQGLNA
jgi:hypothetical protein